MTASPRCKRNLVIWSSRRLPWAALRPLRTFRALQRKASRGHGDSIRRRADAVGPTNNWAEELARNPRPDRDRSAHDIARRHAVAVSSEDILGWQGNGLK